MGDGAEIPGPPATDPAAPVFGPVLGVAPPAGGASLEAARAAIGDAIAERGDALAVAREMQSELTAGLAAADAELAAAQADLDAELQRREEAEAAAETAQADAEEALDEAREARRELRDLAVVMYVDPPQQLQVAAALTGGMSERLAAESLLAAKSDLSQRAAARTERAERRADRLARAADRAVLEAREGAARAEEQMATYAAQVEQRQAAVDLATLQTTALFAEIGTLAQLSPSLENAMGIQSAIASGTVRVAVGADGTWSVATVGFPGAGDIVRIVGTTITVHRLIADQVAALLNAAAADGVVLDGWGYRDTQRQIELRRAHCGPSAEAVFAAPSSSCSPPTARPGRSMHERGLAVDFKNCSSRSLPCYQWLSRNAARFGLFNLPSEPWHWSTNGN